MTPKFYWETELRRRYPIPDTSKIPNYYFSLDGGGRDLITEAITKNSVELMIEIGCFLCGSTLDWLKISPDLKVIGIDHWKLDIGSILERYDKDPIFEPCFSKIMDREEFINNTRSNGAFASAMANIKEYSNRFFPVKAQAPEILHVLHDLGVLPELIYIDSDKVLDDLYICKELFPEAILCGDDWTWGAEKGFPVQKAVKEFCASNNCEPNVKRATWIIIPDEGLLGC